MVVDFVDFFVLDFVVFLCLEGFGKKSVIKLVKVIEVSLLIDFSNVVYILMIIIIVEFF